jgi:hypothetical protein
MRELISSFTVVRLMLYNADSNESGLSPVISKRTVLRNKSGLSPVFSKKGINV